jgi:hypothetical protein
MPSLPSGFFPLGFPTKLLYACLISPMHAVLFLCSPNLHVLYH